MSFSGYSLAFRHVCLCISSISLTKRRCERNVYVAFRLFVLWLSYVVCFLFFPWMKNFYNHFALLHKILVRMGNEQTNEIIGIHDDKASNPQLTDTDKRKMALSAFCKDRKEWNAKILLRIRREKKKNKTIPLSRVRERAEWKMWATEAAAQPAQRSSNKNKQRSECEKPKKKNINNPIQGHTHFALCCNTFIIYALASIRSARH